MTIIAAVTILGVASAATYRTEDIPNVQLQDRTRFVSNPDGLLNESAVREIDALCLSLRERGLAEVVVVAVESIEPDDVFSFAHTLFEGWGVGDDKLDNGLGILLVDDQHEIRFVTGYGLESVLTDALCIRLQQRYMLPHFREGDYSTGMVEGVKAVDALLTNGDLPIAEDDVASDGEITAIIVFVTLMIMLPLILIVIVDRQSRKCPTCGKVALRVVDSNIINRSALSTTIRQTLVCDKCGAEHKRTKKHDNITGGKGGGPIIFGGGGGFGGGGFGGGGFGGGSFGGGSFGGGGGGSRW